MTSVRMDKWLWAARFLQMRALSAHARELGRIQSNAHPAKAVREVRVGDMLRVTNDDGDFQEDLLLSDVRGPASLAQTLYRETEASRELRVKSQRSAKAMRQFEELPAADYQDAFAGKSSSSGREPDRRRMTVQSRSDFRRLKSGHYFRIAYTPSDWTDR